MNVVGMKGRAAGAEPGFAGAQPKSVSARANCEGGGSWGNHGFPHEFEEMTANG